MARLIRDVRLQKVAAELRISKTPIGFIAAANSFDNVQHLANVFKRKFGMTMTEYRRL